MVNLIVGVIIIFVILKVFFSSFIRLLFLPIKFVHFMGKYVLIGLLMLYIIKHVLDISINLPF